ncbi:hypothetical protein T07_6407, partial [Trichinella nelsoni]
MQLLIYYIEPLNYYITYKKGCCPTDEVAEWLRRWTANPLGFPR